MTSEYLFLGGNSYKMLNMKDLEIYTINQLKYKYIIN